MVRGARATVIAVVVSCVVGMSDGATPADAAPRLPNVVVVQTDDQSLNTLRAIPEVRRLIGDEGVTFDRYYVSFSLCCPSRASLLTGQYAHNTGVLGNLPPDGSVSAFDDTRSLPLWLQRRGYATAHVGKYLNLYNTGVPPGWNEWYTGVDPTTYRYYDYVLNENGVDHRYGTAEADYQTDVLTGKAVDFVTRQTADAQPFFLALDYVAPHTQVAQVPRVIPGSPPVPAQRDIGRFANAEPPGDPAYDEADVSDKPGHVRERARLTDDEKRDIVTGYRARLESLLSVDRGVRQLVETLATAGALENTYIVFLSDNGWMDGQHRYPDGKLRIYEPSTHLPLMIRGPGVRRGLHAKALAMNVDIAPTIAELTGATPDVAVDGVSLAPLLREPRTRWNRDVLHEFVAPGPFASQVDPDAQGGTDPSFTAVRSSDGYVYVEHESGDRELYDIATDPHQLRNRGDDPTLRATQARLAASLARLRTCTGASCRGLGPPGPPAAVERVHRTRKGYTMTVRCLLPDVCRTTVTVRTAGTPARPLARRVVRIAPRSTRRLRLRVRSRARPTRVRVVVDAGADGRVERLVRAAG